MAAAVRRRRHRVDECAPAMDQRSCATNRRVVSCRRDVVKWWLLVLVTVLATCTEASMRPMSETLQRAYAASRGPSPGAKKLLNIPEDGADPIPNRHIPLEGYEAELEKDHALPTSVPNADILKTNSNPTYHKPRPPQHHGAAILASVGAGGAPPSYAPPSRSFFTPPLPPEYLNPFADKPTLRGTNADNGNYLNRRPIPPPSLIPGHERIPIRPGQEPPGPPAPQMPAPPAAPVPSDPQQSPQRKKVLNTPSMKVNSGDQDLNIDDLRAQGVPDQANFTDFVPNSLNIPTISRILSGSNGRKEDIPDILLRTVTAKPQPNPQGIPIEKSGKGPASERSSTEVSTEGSALPVLDPEMGNLDRPLIIEAGGESNTRRNLQFATNKNVEIPNPGSKTDGKQDHNLRTVATTVGFILKDTEVSTERIHNLANVNTEGKSLGKMNPKGGSSVSRQANSSGITWPVAWNLHIYLATVLFTILAVYSIFKIICYNKFTHLFTQYYFIILHLILVLVCLMRIFYMCYDPYNINSSLPVFLSEILLHIPEIFLSISFAASVLFLLINSINFKNSCYAVLVRPRTIIIGGAAHIVSCIVLHTVENTSSKKKIDDSPDRKILPMLCQAIYVLVCLCLGLLYVYVYRRLKKVLQKKSHTYIHGFQNLYQAIHINLATAMLFILLSMLQIFGIFGVDINVNMTKYNWLQWGYQFSLRVLEISIVGLISWVISLKVGIVASLQHEKGDGHKISGLGLFPCTASSSNEQFESDYPAVCNANTNLHTYTLRTGKPIYESTLSHRHMQGIPPDQCCSSSAADGQRFQINTLTANCDSNSVVENYSGHSSIANAAHSSSTESSNAASGQSATNHLIKGHHGGGNMGYNADSASDDHYSNCEPVIQNLDDNGDNPLDHEYNVIQYGSSGDFVRDNLKNNPAMPYNGGGSDRSSTRNNFKHSSFDRLSSRNNSGHNASNPRKKHRSKGHKAQPNCMTLGYDRNPIMHRYHHPHGVDEYDAYPADDGSFHTSGIQTLNPGRNYCEPSGSQKRINHSPASSIVNSSGSQKRGKNASNFNADRPISSDIYGFAESPIHGGYNCEMVQAVPRNCYVQNGDPDVALEGDGNSMLVAQDGFVRFRPLDDNAQT